MNPSLSQPLKGLIAAAVTPFYEDGSVDYDAIPTLVERQEQLGNCGLYICGSTGEGVSLTSEERKQVASQYVQASQAQGLVSFIQVGHNSLRAAQELAEHAQEIGATAISATCPSYFKVSSVADLISCMAEIARAAPEVPFYYYHIPALTGSQLSMPDFLQAARDAIPNLAGLKFTTPELHQFQLCQAVDAKLQVFWGTDEMLLPALACGAQAAIGSTYNILAPTYLEVWSAYEAGQVERAREIQLKLVELVSILLQFPFHAALRRALKYQGIEVGPARLPNVNLNSKQIDQLDQSLKAAGFDASGRLPI